MDQASGAVAPPDAEVVQVGDAIRQRAEWRGLVQGAVWPVRVVEVLVLAPKTRIRRVLQPTSRRSSHALAARRRGDEQPAVSGASGQVAQVFGTLSSCRVPTRTPFPPHQL